MLKHIPNSISPKLMFHMMCMGHGDELVLADGDFPATTYSKRVVRADGHRHVTLLKSILKFFPLDSYVEKPVKIMAPANQTVQEPESVGKYREIIREFKEDFSDFDYLERSEFYERSKNAFLVVITSEPDGNLILKKGVVAG